MARRNFTIGKPTRTNGLTSLQKQDSLEKLLNIASGWQNGFVTVTGSVQRVLTTSDEAVWRGKLFGASTQFPE